MLLSSRSHFVIGKSILNPSIFRPTHQFTPYIHVKPKIHLSVIGAVPDDRTSRGKDLRSAINQEPRETGRLSTVVALVSRFIQKWFLRFKILVPFGFLALCALLFKIPLVQQASHSFTPFSTSASVSSSAPRTEHSWADYIQYRFERVLSQKMFGKLTAVLLAATPIVILGGISYKIVTGQNLSQALFKAYTIMGDLPGADMVAEDKILATIICNIIFFSGMFTVAVTLGIICDDISNTVDEVRHGNYQIVEKKHLVILNVNARLPSVLRQIDATSKERGSFRCPVVVLADMDKDKLDRVVSSAAEDLDLMVITRAGCSHDLMDLKRVAAGNAKCVIWLQPDDGDDEISVAARRAASIASIKALGSGQKLPARIVVQTSEDTRRSKLGLVDVPLAYRSPPPKPSNKLHVVEMYEETNLDRLLAQCALQPHLTGVISSVFQHNDGKEFYLVDVPQLAGKYYVNARRHFNTSTVCGVMHNFRELSPEPGVMYLNPPEDYVMHKEDSLVVLCGSLWNTAPLSKALPSPKEWTSHVVRHHTRCESEHIVVLCFGKEGYADSGLIDALGMFAPQGTRVTVVASRHMNKDRVKGNCHLSYTEGRPTSYRTLHALRNQKVDCIVLAGLEDLPPRVADAQFVSTLIQIQEVANLAWEDRTGFSVVGPVCDVKTEQVINHLISEGKSLSVPIDAAMLLPTELTSGILVQVAGYPKLDLVFKELLRNSGCEFYIRTAKEFGLVGKGPIQYLEVADVVRNHHETFIGVLKEDKSFNIAPEAVARHEFTDSDRLVVLAESFKPSKLN